MTNQEKKQVAMNYLVLRASALPRNLPAEFKESLLRTHEILRRVTAELYCECFSDDQLQALLDFYGSEMGESILDAEAEVASRLQERQGDVVRQLNEAASTRPNSPLATFSFRDGVESAVEELEKSGDVTLTATRGHVVDYLCKRLAYLRPGGATRQGV